MENAINWNEHGHLMNRQLRWQRIRNSYYSNLRYCQKNAAAHSRHLMRVDGGAASYEKHAGQNVRMRDDLDISADLYRRALEADRSIKNAYLSGDVTSYETALDASDAIVAEMKSDIGTGSMALED